VWLFSNPEFWNPLEFGSHHEQAGRGDPLHCLQPPFSPLHAPTHLTLQEASGTPCAPWFQGTSPTAALAQASWHVFLGICSPWQNAVGEETYSGSGDGCKNLSRIHHGPWDPECSLEEGVAWALDGHTPIALWTRTSVATL
jgi:hypothetical protein